MLSPALHPSRQTLAIGGAWLLFWTLLTVLGVQESTRHGGRGVIEPLIDYASAAVMATAVAAWQLRRMRRYPQLVAQPLRWFARLWIWVPLLAVFYVLGMLGLRAVAYPLAGLNYKGDPWPQALVYEATKFLIYYLLFSGVHFGVLAFRRWHDERLRSEQLARLAQSAQLTQLTQQLQPHFLFNALNTVSALIHTDPDLADALLTRLARLLRAATDVGQRPDQSLADELSLLRAYADLMTQRFGDRVAVQWDIPDPAPDGRVPTLGLQPLLENCFHHVVERRSALTHIRVHAARDGDQLVLSVEDDGPPVALPLRLGVGLSNLQARLQALHGARAALRISPVEPQGLRVEVRLPCVP